MIIELVKIANTLDEKGLSKEADELDLIIKEAALIDWVQGTLSGIGLIPGVGEIADGINTGISMLRRDAVGVVLNMISMLPVAGDAIAKPINALRTAAQSGGLSRDMIALANDILQRMNTHSGNIIAALEKADEVLARKLGPNAAVMKNVWLDQIMPIVQNAAGSAEA